MLLDSYFTWRLQIHETVLYSIRELHVSGNISGQITSGSQQFVFLAEICLGPKWTNVPECLLKFVKLQIQIQFSDHKYFNVRVDFIPYVSHFSHMNSCQKHVATRKPQVNKCEQVNMFDIVHVERWSHEGNAWKMIEVFPGLKNLTILWFKKDHGKMERNLEKLNVSSLDLLHYMPGNTLSGHLDNVVSSVCTEMA